MGQNRFRAEDLMEFAKHILVHPRIGFTEKQAHAASTILVEADLRGDSDHGVAGASGIYDIYLKVNEDAAVPGFKRLCTPGYLQQQGEKADFSVEDTRYPTIIHVDARGLLGAYVTLELIPEVISRAKRFGYAKAYIRNSTHFGDCGIYTEMIAEKDLAAKVTSTSPAWTKPFVELQRDEKKNARRYSGVEKRFGTNPIAWSIPFDKGIVTIDIAVTQRAVSPAIDVARSNAAALGITQPIDGQFFIGKGKHKTPLRKVHLGLSRIDNEQELKKAIAAFGYDNSIGLTPVEKGFLKGPDGEDIYYPLAFDDVFKENFWIAPLGGTYFGYKGFGLNMLIELDNVVGGGNPELIRRLDSEGRPKTPERVSHTIEAYAIDGLYCLKEAKERLGHAVRVTRECGNKLMFLPGEKEQIKRQENLKKGIPMRSEQIGKLKQIAEMLDVPFDLKPLG
ncbi:MAG: Ldh family oxidoreductase [Deltaproteobacteria bacterium]|nr:Ldh family oxidoreductase [Deltaproteobacteria bacterium]